MCTENWSASVTVVLPFFADEYRKIRFLGAATQEVNLCQDTVRHGGVSLLPFKLVLHQIVTALPLFVSDIGVCSSSDEHGSQLLLASCKCNMERSLTPIVLAVQLGTCAQVNT